MAENRGYEKATQIWNMWFRAFQAAGSRCFIGSIGGYQKSTKPSFKLAPTDGPEIKGVEGAWPEGVESF